MSSRLATEFGTFPTSVLSDALDDLRRFGVTTGFRSAQPGTRAAGVARVGLVVDSDAPGLPGQSELIDGAAEGDFLVVAWAAQAEVSALGGLASLRAQLGGCAGALIDGWVRDVDEIAENLPTWFRHTTPRSGRGRIAVRLVPHAVRVGDLLVTTGDIVVADDTGVCVIAEPDAAAVLDAARAVAERDAAAQARLHRGVPFAGMESDDRDAAR